jgi:Tfp pilus assembly protein PilF
VAAVPSKPAVTVAAAPAGPPASAAAASAAAAKPTPAPSSPADSRSSEAGALSAAALQHFLQDDHDRARKLVERALALDPQNRRALELEKILRVLG